MSEVSGWTSLENGERGDGLYEVRVPLGACIMCPDEDPEHDLDGDGVAPPGGGAHLFARSRSFSHFPICFILDRLTKLLNL